MAGLCKMQPAIVLFSYLWRGCWGRRGKSGREQRWGRWRGRMLGRCNHRCLQATSWSAMRQAIHCPESCTSLVEPVPPFQMLTAVFLEDHLIRGEIFDANGLDARHSLTQHMSVLASLPSKTSLPTRTNTSLKSFEDRPSPIPCTHASCWWRWQRKHMEREGAKKTKNFLRCC